ncbi:predicted protein [Naegleria gruberi]|uniref:Predicted protein n=1 Tax=Naegleria gruberi TaxID=5762 RepID=D2V5G6_NAEGR|nr:uncharacterized protein NAEGRDRAFT_63815 [Naegleria gruberi]EFC47945.1 predicted protein [Naegleria gruberi]|eukprot:XP_002680689.1 predicted protein [Naegleria gruberi strain NEG-M]
MENLIKFLKGEIADCSQGISSYMPKFDRLTENKGNISALTTHKYELTKKNKLLMEEIEQLRSQEGTLDVSVLVNDLETRQASLNEEIEQVNLSKQMILEEQLEINGQSNALTMLNLAQQEEIEELKKELAKLIFQCLSIDILVVYLL